MKLSKPVFVAAMGAVLFSVTALAHPHAKDDSDSKEEKVKIYKFKGDDGGIKGTLKFKDFHMDGVDLDTFIEEMQSLEGLKGLEALEQLKQLESLKGLSQLSRLSELGNLSDLADLGEFDIQTFDSEDGGKKIIIKRGKDGVLGKHEFHWDSDRSSKMRKEFVEKFEDSDADSSRHVIKRMMKKRGENREVEIWADEDMDRHADKLELEDDTWIVLDNEGDVKVLNDNGDMRINIDKDVTVENGKRKTRIIIETESDVD